MSQESQNCGTVTQNNSPPLASRVVGPATTAEPCVSGDYCWLGKSEIYTTDTVSVTSLGTSNTGFGYRNLGLTY